MNNPYQAWNEANAALSHINETCKALTLCLNDLELAPLHRLVIQGFLLQILESIQSYANSVQPMLEAMENK